MYNSFFFRFFFAHNVHSVLRFTLCRFQSVSYMSCVGRLCFRRVMSVKEHGKNRTPPQTVAEGLAPNPGNGATDREKKYNTAS